MTPPGEGGVADENHSWMCGARARFLNRDDSSPGEGLHQRRLDWRHSRALCRPSRLIGSCRRLRDRPPRSEPPETIKHLGRAVLPCATRGRDPHGARRGSRPADKYALGWALPTSKGGRAWAMPLNTKHLFLISRELGNQFILISILTPRRV
jgi:hypothetical protein